MMRHEFLDRNRDALIARCREKVAMRGFPRAMSHMALIDTAANQTKARPAQDRG